jgi:hypothetical protein
VWKLLAMLQAMQFDLDLSIAQRCRGWVPET